MNRWLRAFTLVEVTLAIGIASFALLVIFSVLPTGLATLQSTSKQIVETEIFDKIGSELSSMPLWNGYGKATADDALTNYAGGPQATPPTRFPAFFDAEGNEIAKAAGTSQVASTDLSRVVYTVELATPSPITPTTQWAPLAGNSSSWGQGELRWCTVRIGLHFDPKSKDSAGQTADVRSFMLSNNGVSPTPTPSP